MLTYQSMLERLQLSLQLLHQDCIKLSPCQFQRAKWTDTTQVEVAVRRMVNFKWPFEIKSFDDCARLEVWKSSRISKLDDHQDRSPGMKLDNHKFEAEAVVEGSADKGTKQSQRFHAEVWTGIQTITMSTEQSRMELGQLHMRENVEVFGEKDAHLRECKFATPRFGSIRPKYDPKLEYKCGVQTLLYQATHKAFKWREPVICMKTWKLMMKSKSGTLQGDSDSDWHDDKIRTNNSCIMSSSKEVRRAISDTVKFVLQVLETYGWKVSSSPREQITEPVGEIKFVKDGNRRNDFSQESSLSRMATEGMISHKILVEASRSADMLR